MIITKHIAKCFFVLALVFVSAQANATHIMGGELTYKVMAHDPATNTTEYIIELNFYRYCIFNFDTTAPLFNSLQLEVYQDNTILDDTIPWMQELILVLDTKDSVAPPFSGPNCGFVPGVCVQHGYYTAFVTLPNSIYGYHLAVQTGARNGTILNLQNPLQAGIVFYGFIPPGNLQNNTPYFSDLPLPFVCINDTLTLINNARDDDGDILRYHFVTPYESLNYDTTTNFNYTSPLVFPLFPVHYNPGYTFAQPFGPGSFASIDSVTGLTKFYVPNQGFYVVAMEVSEYRNGVLISRIRRDYQVIAIVCPPNASPDYSPPASQTATTFSITEGDTLCLQTIFTDADNDSLFLTSSGEVFTSQAINPKATFTNTYGLGTVTGNVCWITQCGYARPAPYQFTISAHDDGCPQKKTDIIFSVTVTPRTVLLPAPTVNFTFTPPDPFCPGTQVRFTATHTNGGSFPVYQWNINGTNVQGDSVFITTELKNNDVVGLSLTSSHTCIVTSSATATPYTFTIYDAPDAQFDASPSVTDELQSTISFSNQTTNAVLYQWDFGDGFIDSVYSPQHEYADTGHYTVLLTATNTAGCMDTLSENIAINPVPTVYMPAAFTPNDDGINDFFLPVFNGYHQFELYIFNRWGMRVFYTNTASAGWGGADASRNVCQQGTYIYHLVLKSNLEVKTLNGIVNLIR